MFLLRSFVHLPLRQFIIRSANSGLNTICIKHRKYEKMILEITKEINSEEELLDANLTSFKDIQEKLEIAQKESVEAELQAWFSTKINRKILMVSPGMSHSIIFRIIFF